MALRDALDRIANDTETAVDGLFFRRRGGQITEARFETLAAARINRANARAAVTTDVAVSTELTRQTGERVRPTGFRPFSDQVRLKEAVRATAQPVEPGAPATPEESEEQRRNRLRRLSRSEPYSTSQNTFHAVAGKQQVRGWVRVTNAGACPLCRKWADGKVRPAGMRMIRHRGCTCVQRPVAMKKKRKAAAAVATPKAQVAVVAEQRVGPGRRLAVTGAQAVGTRILAQEVVPRIYGRARVLAGGRQAYRHLRFLENLITTGGPALETRKARLRLLVDAGVNIERYSRDLEVLDGGFLQSNDVYAFLDTQRRLPYSPEEADALWDYAGLHITPDGNVGKGPVLRYHRKLRSGEALTDQEETTVRLVDQAIDRNPLHRDVTVWRGAMLPNDAADRLAQAQVGERIFDDAYMFTGLTENRAYPHAARAEWGKAPERYRDYKGVMFKIRAPKGMPAIHSPYGEALAANPRRLPFPLRSVPGLPTLLRRGGRRMEIPVDVAASFVLPRPLAARIPAVLGKRTMRIRIPFIEYFNKEELVLPRRTALVVRSTRLRPDGLIEIEVDAIRPAARPIARRAGRLEASTAEPVPPRITAARPTAKRATGPGASVMDVDLIADKNIAETLRRQVSVPGFEDLARRKPTRAVFDEVIRRQANHMLGLAERSWRLSPDATELHAQWYPFAHRWLNDLVDKANAIPSVIEHMLEGHGLSPEFPTDDLLGLVQLHGEEHRVPDLLALGHQAPLHPVRTGPVIARPGSYAATAALSPGAEWPNNIAWAKRLIEAIADQHNIVVPQEWVDARYVLEVASGKRTRRRLDLVGKRLSELSDEDTAYVIRAWHDHDPVKQLGGHAGFGNPNNTAMPQSATNLVKAIKVLRDPTPENIDRTLGGMKVRSFYNNLARPLDTEILDITVDTHHFGAANGIPMTTSSRFIESGDHNITETPKDTIAGIGGTYPVVTTATRRATEEFNRRHGTHYLPNQFQSIVWEQWRAEYPSDYRTNWLVARIEKNRTLRARGRITPTEEAALIEEDRRRAGAPSLDEILEWYRYDLADQPRPMVTEMRRRRR